MSNGETNLAMRQKQRSWGTTVTKKRKKVISSWRLSLSETDFPKDVQIDTKIGY